MSGWREPDGDRLIAWAKHAWGEIGNCALGGWYVHPDSSYVVVATGHPPRAKHEYVYAFLFAKSWHAGQPVWYLKALGRAPWFERLSWRGGEFTRKRTAQYFGPHEWQYTVPERGGTHES